LFINRTIQQEPYLSRVRCRVGRFLTLIMCITPVLVHSDSVYIDRPGKEFSSSQSSNTRFSSDGFITAQQAGNENLWRLKPDSNRHNAAQQDNPWRSDGRVYSSAQHKLRPWGGVPADAPALPDRQQRYYGKAENYRYQPAPMRPYPMPGYGGYGNVWSSPYGARHMPGYGRGRGGGNQFFPFGSFNGMPGPGFPGGMFW